ncbi:MAG: hypothetical protein WCH42_06845 [Actinomycetes bacterium]
MSTLLVEAGSWVTFDSGTTSFSRKHLEALISKRANDLGLKLDWLVSYQLNTGVRRIAFVIGSKNRALLNELKDQLGAEFPSFSGQAELAALQTECISRDSGRLVIFPFTADISGLLPAKDLLEHSIIEEIVAIGETMPSEAVLKIDNYLRPIFEQGKVKLLVERVADGFFAPVEREAPHECCGDHDDFEL